MATNPITANQIIDAEGVIKALTDVESHLVSLKEALKIKAKDIKITVNNGGDMTSFLSQVNAITDAMGRLKEFSSVNTEMLKAFTDAQKAAASATRKRVDTNNDYYDSLRKIDKEERELDKIRETTINKEKLLNGEITTSALSYNQLSAVYSNMSSVLKNMSKAEIEASEGMRRFAAVTKQVRDGMNEAQKAMGNYSLNVGKYHTAFDGLGYSIQQVLREIPSAINVQQFFLAISNNIPIVIDQMKLFNAEQMDIKKQLEGVQKGTKEYIELQGRMMTMGQKFIKSIFNWQSAILVVLLLLRKIPGVIEAIKSRMGGLVSNFKIFNRELAEVNTNAKKAYQSVVVELGLISNQIHSAKIGSEEWKDAIARVSEITGKTLNSTKATVAEVDKITEAYIRQAKQIAINKQVVDKLAESDVNQTKRDYATDISSLDSRFITKEKITEQIAGSIGVSRFQAGTSKLTDEYKKLQGLVDDVFLNGVGQVVSNPELIMEWIKQYMAAISDNEMDRLMKKTTLKNANGSGIAFNSQESAKELANYITAYTPILKDADYNRLRNMYSAVDDPNKKNGSGLKSHKDIDTLAQEASMVESNNMEESIEQRLQLLTDKMEAEKVKLQEFMDKQLEKYMFNKENGLLTEEDERNMSELQVQYDNIMNSLQPKYDKLKYEEILKYNKEIMDSNVKRANQEMDTIELELKDATVVVPKRVKSKDDEISKNEKIRHNIESIKNAMQQLESVDVWTPEQLEKRNERLANLNKQMEKYNSQLSWSKQIANYKGLGDLMGAEGMLEGLAGGDKAGFLSALGLDMSGASPDQVDSVFDEWMNNASEAMVKWKDITIDSLGQILDAYVDFYQARADAAAEDTDKAKEAYELQKSLLEQGYANSVSTAWAEYQEKQALQKKAEEDAKNAEKVQKAADSASTASNLIVASSNILKQFAANPILAGILLSTMWGSFAAAKVMAFKASKYEEGGYEELTGGSHASGHDINLGVMNGKGRSMVAEGGESIGIFSRKAKRKYGSQTIADIVNSINNGTYEKTTTDRLNDNVAISVKPYRSASVNLTRIENTLDSIDRNGKSSSYVDGNGNRVVTNGNAKTTYIKR